MLGACCLAGLHRTPPIAPVLETANLSEALRGMIPIDQAAYRD
jgi:hypothetical protein